MIALTTTRRITVITMLVSVALLLGAAAPTGAGAAVDLRVNFQPMAAPVPAGYTPDVGGSFSATQGFGWVRQDSLGGTPVPLDITPNTRDRNTHPDQRLDTLIHMQYPASGGLPGNVTTPAAWEVVLPNGSYDVTVSVGDAADNVDSSHQISIEGVIAIDQFVPTSTTRFASATRTVTVGDGRLTLSAAGGTNTKLNFVTVSSSAPVDTSPPAAPADLTAIAEGGAVTLDWADNAEGDLAGYRVYRATSSPVPTSGTPLNGATLLTTSTFVDPTATEGASWHYVVIAVDTTGNTSDPSNDASATVLDSTAPAAPTGLTAAADTDHATIDWADNTEPDVAGYHVFRATSQPVPTSGTPLNGSTLLTSSDYTDHQVSSGSWHYVAIAVDHAGNTSQPSNAAAATFDTPPRNLHINFQPQDAPVPTGYTPDTGAPFTTTRGYGWIHQDTITTTHTPLDITPNTRDRNTHPDQRLDTLIHMQYPPSSGLAGNVTTPAAWEAELPNGSYDVTVSVGDAADNVDSSHQISIEGVDAIAGFVPSGAAHHASVTRTVTVGDGRLTLSAAGGTNTKLNFVTVSSSAPVDTSPPAAPADLTAIAEGGAVTLDWADNAEGDLAGYRVYRATSSPVPTSGTPLNGATLLTTSTFVDPTATEGASWHYVVIAVDTTGNTSDPSNDASATVLDSTAPAAPTGLTAAADTDHATIDWADNTEPDVAGYHVFRSTSQPVPTSGTPLNGSTLLTSSDYTDHQVSSGSWHYVAIAVDHAGNTSQPSNAAAATFDTPPRNLHINFQPQDAPVPTGYTPDTGAPFTTTRGYGWIHQDTITTTHTPLDITPNTRDRNTHPDQRLDTLIHMQYPASGGLPGNVTTPAAWEAELPNGSYHVTVSVGDAADNVDSSHQISIEGVIAIDQFVPTSTTRFASATRTITVGDGRLTLSAAGGTNTKLNFVTVTSVGIRPSVTSSSPADGQSNVRLDSAVTAELFLPVSGANVDATTLDADSVFLTRVSDGVRVPANLNTSGGGDVIVLQPTQLLDPFAQYRFDVTSSLKDAHGSSFVPYSATFTTGTESTPPPTTDIAFEHVALPTAQSLMFTSTTMGPDGKLYAATFTGQIVRWTLQADGTLGAAQVIDSLRAAEGGGRTVLGLEFDPSSTAGNLVLWVSNNDMSYSGAADWTGKITRMSGPELATVQDYVVGLPRSVQDHETNSIEFGPDGRMYVLQGSNTAMGAPDNAWGQRAEHLLTAAVLAVDVGAITSPPLDVKTEAGGTYDPSAPGAPVTLYATGVRNAYDLSWHSNGTLYVPANSSAAGGSTPATPTPLPASCADRIDSVVNGPYEGPQVPGLTNVPEAQPDVALTVREGGYYGHPNPARCEWVLFGGNPTSDADPLQVSSYPVGTEPDRNWRRADTFDMGKHYSPNGIVEYRSNRFGGALQGKLLVARYSAGDDIVVLDPTGPDDTIAEQVVGIPGLSGFVDPLDVTENPATGDLYVTELGASRITLLRPVETSGSGDPDIATSATRLMFTDSPGNATASQVKPLQIGNTGSSNLTVTAISIAGTDSGEYAITGAPALPATVPPGGSIAVDVSLAAMDAGVKTATLTITSDAASAPSHAVQLRGLGVAGEPSLQRIMDAYALAIDAGDDDPETPDLAVGGLLGDEVSAQRFVRATPGIVTIDVLGVFGPAGPNDVAGRIGWIPAGTPQSVVELLSIANSQITVLEPEVTGTRSFDPGSAPFSIVSTWPPQGDRRVYQEDALNTFANAFPHHVRVYPVRDATGALVPHTYLLAMEEITDYGDFQDGVIVVRNVDPA